MPWVRNVHSGGVKIPKAVQERTRLRILEHAALSCATRWQIEVRFRGALCYVDAVEGPASDRLHLVRLRYFGNDERWSVAFYTYSHEQYEPTFFPSGDDQGTPEQAFDIGAVYLVD